MDELQLRKLHRRMGVALALLILIQAGSGLIISVSELVTPHSHAHKEITESHGHHSESKSMWHEMLEFVHHGAGRFGIAYRIVVGIGTLAVTVTGCIIFLKIKARSKKSFHFTVK